ncbi:2'-5' RNA ligase family protein [Chelativorans sp. AA-79]|uniref:2'-5' RNA ligase family protein n=1 Tax=Chelativorans sp. AA-79 TaxID=3028735 RepID=UPI0023F71466|nr:2'-5' RNA ligase family protein [Chelativorans sp. AA-79]WEX08187.1 2'-5' RNA ligase family protein [Chelativorans sp. AA-79]
MYAQYAFDFMEPLPPRPKLAERLIFMLFPDPVTAVEVDRFGSRFIREHSLAGKRLRRARLHISLHHLGDYRKLRSTIVYAATQAAKVVFIPPFDITFRSIVSFAAPPRKKERPLVLLGEGEGLTKLHQALAEAQRKNGLRASDRLTPHMTLFYGEGVPAQAIEPIRFTARDFALVHSKLWLSEYDVLGRWPLRG